MITSTATPTAQRRKRRTRTKNVSARPALVISTLAPTHYDLLPGTENLACPDCATWCPVTGARGQQPKVVPHHTAAAGTPGARRCIGSNRAVVIDVTAEQRAARIEEGVAETAARRATKVLRKVKAPTPAAVLRIAQPGPAVPEPTAAERAEQWAEVLLAVFVADTLRRIALIDAPGDVRGPICGIEAPMETLRPTA